MSNASSSGKHDDREREDISSRLSLIVAVSENQVIGRDGDLPWRLSSDLRRFKRLTMGHHLIMGRKTYESIGRPLPGRTSIVLTRQTQFSTDSQVHVVRSLDEALQLAAEDPEVFVIGGGQIYEAALPHAARIYLTRVHTTLDGDTYFPTLDATEWQMVSTESHGPDEKNDYAHSFEIWNATEPRRFLFAT